MKLSTNLYWLTGVIERDKKVFRGKILIYWDWSTLGDHHWHAQLCDGDLKLTRFVLAALPVLQTDKVSRTRSSFPVYILIHANTEGNVFVWPLKVVRDMQQLERFLSQRFLRALLLFKYEVCCGFLGCEERKKRGWSSVINTKDFKTNNFT